MLDEFNQVPIVGPVAILPEQAIGRRPWHPYLAVKRSLDLIAVLLAAPLWVPLVALLALLTRRDGGPAFYAQYRVGLNGRVFLLWKLRSMVPDADACLERFLAADSRAREEWDATQKLRADPRVTPVGRFLRKYSLDELPQLWNVLVGDMSLVGPRPMFPAQQALYPGTAYYQLRPGLTGFWQISERNNVSFAERARYDNRYAECISLRTDLSVLVGTVGVVVRGTGC
jgi:lipopolysaccharide/colanic/teichoic acid biosynthesis glycosyltransferase